MPATNIALLLITGWCAAGCSENRAEAGPPADTTAVAAAADSIRQLLQPEARELVLRAREFDRADLRDSARIAYLDAAGRLPLIRDWLLLRAAGVIADSAERARLYARLGTAVARDRARITEALARERTGDIEGAIRAFRAADAPISAFRLRIARANEPAARDALRGEMLTFMDQSRGSELGRDALALFDESFPSRNAQEELRLARTAAAAGRAERAVAGFSVATRAGLGTTRDRFTYAGMLARLNRQTDAISQYTRVTSPAALAAAAQYQIARMRIAAGNVSAARRTLRNVTSEWPTDTSAASALMLLADLATDENRDADARSALRMAAERFPNGRHAPAALFRAAMIAYIQQQYRMAATEFAQIASRYPRSDDATAARYWSGRALAAAGNRAAADSAWRGVLAGDPGSYYSVLVTRRLRAPLPLGDSAELRVAAVATLDSAISRAALLQEVGMSIEARHEYDRLFRDASENRNRMLATAEAFAGTEHASRAITIGWRLVNEVGRNPRTYRTVYPLIEREAIVREARASNVDPVLMAALIRQESNFNPRATSPAGARGLMQIMPSVGQQLAVRRGIRGYTPEMLYEPEVNLALGALHLRNMLSEYPNLERALAAYNAGGSRVRRWAGKAGAEDPEVFTERIPFVETRGYVRAIVRNRAFYRALYPW